jgi:hypothetical protein
MAVVAPDTEAEAATGTAGAVGIMAAVITAAVRVTDHHPKVQDRAAATARAQVPAGMATRVAVAVAAEADHQAATSARTAVLVAAGMVAPAAATDKPNDNGALRSAVFFGINTTFSASPTGFPASGPFVLIL